MTERNWAHQLNTGIAAALDSFDPPEIVDEALVARVLRQVARESDDLGHSLFLRAIADALDHPSATLRLTLSKAGRGRPADETKVERALLVGSRVEGLVREGWKKEAAVQQAMTDFSLSRSAVIRSSTEYRKLRPLMDSVQVSVDSVRRRKSTNPANS